MDAVSVLVHVRGTSNIVERPPQRAPLARVPTVALVVAHEVVVLAVGTLLLCVGLVARVLAEALPYAGQRVLAESRLLGRPR